MIELIITADDCGLSQGINENCAQLYEQGLLSAASVMPNCDYVDHAYHVFANYPALEVGAHLTLTDGLPLTQAAQRSELTRSSGKFRNQFFLYPQALFPSDDLLAAIREELTAQMLFCASFGVPIAHITTHHHFHLFPALRNIIYDLAAAFDVGWVRNSDYRDTVLPVTFMLNKDVTDDSTSQFTVPDFVVLIKSWQDSPPQALLDELLTLHGTVELVVHPSIPYDESYPRGVRYTPIERHQETQYLQKLGDLLQPHLGREITVKNAQEQYRAG